MRSPQPLSFVLLLALAATPALCGAVGEPKVPASAANAAGLVPGGWKAVATATGDLNRDGRPDTALVLARKDAPADADADETPRPVVLALRGRDGRLHRALVARHAILPRNGGGILGDPFAGIAIQRGALVIRHYGGSSWRWGFTDRFRLQEGRWRLIGSTQIEHRTINAWRREVDANLSTGLVLESEHPEGPGPVSRQAYFELRAGPAPRPPAVDGVLARGEWPGRSVTLRSAADVVEGKGAWRGARDLSAVLGALATRDSLFLRAHVTDNRVGAGDGVRLVDARGKRIAPAETRTRGAAGGYVVEARYPLADVPGKEPPEEREPVLRLSVEVVDGAGGAAPVVLSTSRGGRRYPAAIRLARTTDLPLLDDHGVEP